MIAEPSEIWRRSVGEGERRVNRGIGGLASTGLIGGADVMLGVVAMVVVSGAMESVMTREAAHIVGSLVFGIGFVFIVVGRSELFTENFLVPVAAVYHGRGTIAGLARLWIVTLLFNLFAMVVLAALFSSSGVLRPGALEAAGDLAARYVERDVWAALLSALMAGGVMTLFSWFVHAVDSDIARVSVALLTGFLLAAPALNHAVVSFGEVLLGITAGAADADVGDLLRNLAVATAGNAIGGIGLVTMTRLIQVRGEPDNEMG